MSLREAAAATASLPIAPRLESKDSKIGVAPAARTEEISEIDDSGTRMVAESSAVSGSASASASGHSIYAGGLPGGNSSAVATSSFPLTDVGGRSKTPVSVVVMGIDRIGDRAISSTSPTIPRFAHLSLSPS